ncbi:hypothetical protein AB0K43_17240 [Kitasatospora sp. NPDC049258]|uniref:hypothetical protein n=1 Tax=Kitasatospora sp. NPDC049258 TaxID=3155394 RepID=UPI003439CBCA
MTDGRLRADLARARTLTAALLWRMRQERLRNALTVLLPFVLTASSVVALPLLGDDSAMNGAAGSAELGLQYGATGDTVAAGMLLVLLPGVVALHCTVGAALAVRNVVGTEAGVGALESMLAAPYTPTSIAGGLLGLAMVVTTAQWAVMSALAALAMAIATWAHHDSLALGAGYPALALGLPLLSAWAAAALALLCNLLMPKLSQPGQSGLAGNAGGLINIIAMLPGLGAMLALATGLGDLGPSRLLLVTGGATVAVIAGCLLGIARGFRPESVLGS